jgi:phosphate transport system substrate-binding protein
MRSIIFTLAIATCAWGCKSKGGSSSQGSGSASGQTTTGGGGTVSITGAGSTFVYPLMSKWQPEFSKAHANVEVNYQSIGSGGGIRQLLDGTVDFGASDVPMTKDELAKAKGPILTFPDTLGAVVIAYNLPDVEQRLNLTADDIAGIYLGDIKKWNDKKIADANPGVTLPDEAIAVAYRSDGSGTTGVYTSYLAAVSPTWKDKVGVGKSVSFPVGSGAKGNEGVAGLIKSSPGTIGYIELAYAKQTKQPYAMVQNQAGKMIDASPDSVSAAAAAVAANMPDSLTADLVNAPGDASYPISSFSYFLVYQNSDDPAKGKAVADFIWWALHDGQQYSGNLLYAPLPKEVVAKCEAKLETLTAKGQVLLSAK